jgi:tetratricopeptide (TPR) repeat protein
MNNELREAYQHALHLHNSGKLQEALPLYERLLPHLNENAHVLYAVGSALAQIGSYGLATVLLHRSVVLDPSNYEAWTNLGLSYRTAGLVDKAIAIYKHVLGMKVPESALPGIYGNLSGCFVNEGRPEECLKWAEMGLRTSDIPQLHNHRALALLELGRYKEGFEEYENRFHLPEFTNRDYKGVPKWDGSKVGSLVIHGEQGLGDEILFLTQMRKVLPLADEIHVECASRLVGLLRHSFREHPQVKFYPTHDAVMKAGLQLDAWTAMGSLPATLWPFERHVYLQSSRKFLRPLSLPRIGISWRGGTMKTHDYYRNAPLDSWKVLVQSLRSRGAEVISLQYGPAEEAAQVLGVEHRNADIADLDSLTGLIQSCDVVLSVCNTAIHLAGASGTKCVVVVPTKPAWRYGLTGSHSDWYDSVEYERQLPGEDLGRTVQRVYDHPLVQGVLC